jgi:hypothetical protein
LRSTRRQTNAETTPAPKRTANQANAKKSQPKRQTQSGTADRPKKQAQCRTEDRPKKQAQCRTEDRPKKQTQSG